MKIPKTLRWQATNRALGQGGQTQVVVVTDTTGEFSGECALKGLTKGKPPKAYERFAREVDAIKQLNCSSLPNESIKIIDFGLCQMPDNETITLTDEGVGTQNYMAPECEAGASASITCAADLYSIGKLLWSAITNKMAFARENPAFNEKSMSEEFPDSPETWHLHHLFEGTIRHKPSDRFSDSSNAHKCACHVRKLITAGHPPLEVIVQGRCPSCGWGLLQPFHGDHMVFGNPNPQGIVGLQCDYCGECFALNRRGPKAILQKKNAFVVTQRLMVEIGTLRVVELMHMK